MKSVVSIDSLEQSTHFLDRFKVFLSFSTGNRFLADVTFHVLEKLEEQRDGEVEIFQPILS